MDRQTQKNLLNIVKNNYEDIAEQFSETRKKHLWPELAKISKAIPAGTKVLDVGCGNGRLLESFKEKEIDYLGVDTSENLLKIAKEMYPEKNFCFGDILDLGKLSEIDYDYIFCVAVLQHIPSVNLQITALKQLKNKVASNGKIIITVWNLWGQKKYRKIIFKFWLLKLIGKNKMDVGDILFDWSNTQGDKVSKRYYHAFRKAEIKKICKKASLKIDKLYKDNYNLYVVLKK